MANDALECSLEPQTEMLDEDQAMVSAARQDTEATGRLYDKYYGEILGYIYHCTLNHAVTEDLTSNVFLTAFGHLGRYKWQQIPFRAWLYRIATNAVRMHYRRHRRVRLVSLQPEHEELAAPVSSSSEAPAAAEEYRLVHKAMLELRLKYRTVIILRYFENKTISEIASITGKKEGTIKSQLHRGLAQVKEILVRWGVLPD